MKIKSIHDNEGRTLDRFTILFADGSALGLSQHPDSPQGVSQWGEASSYHRLGKRISFLELPENVREHINKRIIRGT